MIGEDGAPGFRHAHDAFDFTLGREIAGLVVEARGNTPRTLLEAMPHHPPHPLDRFGRRPGIGRAHHLSPDAVEADVGAHVQGEARARVAAELRVEVGGAGAVGVQDLGGDPLGEHVLGAQKAFGCRV